MVDTHDGIAQRSDRQVWMLALLVGALTAACTSDECTAAADRVAECGRELQGDTSCRYQEDVCAAACFQDASCREIKDYLDGDADELDSLPMCVDGCVIRDDFGEDIDDFGYVPGPIGPPGGATAPVGALGPTGAVATAGPVPAGSTVAPPPGGGFGTDPAVPGEVVVPEDPPAEPPQMTSDVPPMTGDDLPCEQSVCPQTMIGGFSERCCTDEGECGVVVNGYCLDLAAADNACSTPSCCTRAGYCGVPNPADGECFMMTPGSSSVQTCDGDLQALDCGDGECDISALVELQATASALGLCCTSDGQCGLFTAESSCIDVSSVDADCPRVDGELGCCTSDDACGVLDPYSGECSEIEQPQGQAIDVTLCDGSVERHCGDAVCPMGLLDEFPGFLDVCCADDAGCGLSDQAGNCVPNEALAIDCPGGCCTDDGYCGAIVEGSCRVTLATNPTTDCEGNISPFSCAQGLCPGGTEGEVLCCTAEGECGLILNDDCVARSVADSQCPDPPGAVGCCAGDVCGAWDGSSDACVATEYAEGDVFEDCAGDFRVACQVGSCSVTLEADGQELDGCCLDDAECGVWLDGSCYPSDSFDSDCYLAMGGCCFDGTSCGELDPDTASCVASDEPTHACDGTALDSPDGGVAGGDAG